MAHTFDSNGQLDVELLTPEEKQEIHQRFEEILNGLSDKWYSEFGPTISSNDLDVTEEDVAEKLKTLPEDLIWTDYYYVRDVKIDVVKGLSVWVRGPAIVRGIEEDEDVMGYLFSTKPWGESDGETDTVFYSAECECPFCVGGEDEGQDCVICEASGNWEWSS